MKGRLSIFIAPIVTKFISVGSAVMTAPASARVWGQEGHAIVAEIAQRRLSGAARSAISSILTNISSTLTHASLASWQCKIIRS
jgi:hypothetical protein